MGSEPFLSALLTTIQQLPPCGLGLVVRDRGEDLPRRRPSSPQTGTAPMRA